MDFVIELFLTAVVALLFSFLIAKLVSAVHGGSDSESVKDVREDITMEELQSSQHESKVEGFESEKRVAFVAEEHVKEVEQKTVDAREDEIVTDFNRLLDDDEKLVGEGALKNASEFPERSEAVVEKELGEENVYTNSEIERSEPMIEEESGVESLVNQNDDVTSFLVSEVDDDRKAVIEQESELKRIENVNTNLEKEIAEPVIENDSGVESLENENDDVTDFAVPEKEDDKKAVIEQASESKRIEKIEEVVVDEDDDWEGIERSELEKTFAAAAKFVNSGNEIASVGSDVQMELYGLHKVATEGPCRESQPMALMMSARAKWNAWQRLGNMNPELAMEQYISVLSEKDPSWMEEHSAVMGDGKREPSVSEAEMPTCKDPDLSSLAAHDPPLANEHTPEMKPNSEGREVTSGSSVGNQGKDDENSF